MLTSLRLPRSRLTTTVRRYDVSSNGAREPAPTEPAATTTAQRYDVSSQGARKPVPTEPEKTTVRRHFYHVLSLTIQLEPVTVCLISLTHTHQLSTTHCQPRTQLLLFGEAGLQAVSQSAVVRCTSSQQGDCARGLHAILSAAHVAPAGDHVRPKISGSIYTEKNALRKSLWSQLWLKLL